MAKKKANKMDQELVAICDHQNIDIKALIHEIRGQQVLLDRDLAMLYGVENKRLNEQVKRNKSRFPEDFMFQLNTEEMRILKSQFATSSWGGSRKRPYAFTRNGVAMLSSVLRSETAVGVNIRIMRAFTAIPQLVNQSIQMVERIVNNEHHQQKLTKRLSSFLIESMKYLQNFFPKRFSPQAVFGMHGHTFPTWYVAPKSELF